MSYRVAWIAVVCLAAGITVSGAGPTEPSIMTAADVELVKLFGCTFKAGIPPETCAGELESKANVWLQEKQPGIRIKERKLESAPGALFLLIVYEVSEWRVIRRPSAEAPKQ